MERLREYIRSFIGAPLPQPNPNRLPSNIEEDLRQEFDTRFPGQRGSDWSTPDVEWHVYQEQFPDVQDFEEGIEGGDMFDQIEQLFENFFEGLPFSPPGNLFEGPRIAIEDQPQYDDDPGFQNQPGHLRDRMLKNPYSDDQRHFGHLDEGNSWSQRGPWGWPSHNDQPQDKIDKDLDGDLESGKQSLDDILSKKDKPLDDNYHLIPSRPRSSSQSYSSITTIDSNGNRESRTTRRDSSGREETTVIRRNGDKEHTTKTWRNEDGSEQTEENIIDINPDSSPMSSVFGSIFEQFFSRR